MAVFVTGGNGHIASWTAYFLAKEGEKVIIYDTQPRAPDYLTEVSENSHIFSRFRQSIAR